MIIKFCIADGGEEIKSIKCENVVNVINAVKESETVCINGEYYVYDSMLYYIDDEDEILYIYFIFQSDIIEKDIDDTINKLKSLGYKVIK